MRIYFTKHALEKFDVLQRHGITTSKRMVLETVEKPELVDHSRRPLIIAQRGFDKTRVLRVVYKEDRGIKIIITFYPARKTQYEK